MINASDAATQIHGRAVREVRRLDRWLILAAAILIFFGLTAINSVDAGHASKVNYFPKQLLWLAVGIIPGAIFAIVDSGFWRKAQAWLYSANLILLVAVLLKGKGAGGAQRWIEIGSFQFQPSEMSKLILVLTLATFFANRPDDIKRPGTFALSFLHVLPGLVLVFMQPHLGATLTLIAVWLAVSLYAGVPWKFVVVALLLGGGMTYAAVKIPLLKPYQLERLNAMVNPDAKGNRYQYVRAEIAFGVGGVLGTGYKKGEEKAAGYIPEQHTDFIFTVIGEEGGLVGSTLLLGAFGFLFYRIWLIGYLANDPYRKMVAGGIFSMLAFHTIVNIAMNLGVGPVVGLWLPFVSYGGTALWLCMASIGLLANLRSYEQEKWFG